MQLRVGMPLALLLLSCVPPGVRVEGELRGDLVGHWAGHLEREQRVYPIGIDIVEQGASVQATLDLPEYCIYGSPLEVRVRGDRILLEGAKISLEASLEGEVLRGESKGFQDVRAELYLELEEREPVAYRHEELFFESGDARLAATFVAPTGAGPFPTIVWTHGSGRDTRETFYYAGRAHLLAQNGVASLIYDKRGAGQSTGSEAWNLERLVEDAVAALRAIAGRPDVNAEAIGLAGFSQGGWVAPLAAIQEPEVDFLVVGATPGISGAGQNIFSAVSRLRRDGFPDEDLIAAEDFLTQLYDFYATGEGRPELLLALEEAQETRWYESRWVSNVTFIDADDGLRQGRWTTWEPFARDPSTTWSQIEIPVLSIWGAQDIDVPAELSRRRIEEALRSAGNPDFELRLFPHASHGLWDEGERDGWDWERQVTDSHDLIVEWVVTRYEPPAGWRAK